MHAGALVHNAALAVADELAEFRAKRSSRPRPLGSTSRCGSRSRSLKPYPCGRNLHGLIDASARARSAHADRQIERIEVRIDPKALARATLSFPEHVVAAQFSIPFAVALSTATGRTSLADFDAPGNVPAAVKALFARVHVQPHDATPEDQISFTYAGGAKHTESAAGVRLGHPSKPLSREQIGNKLRDCNGFAGAPLSEQSIEALLSAALRVERLASTTELTRLLRVEH